MAKEDLLAQLQRDLMLKEGPPPPDENNPIPQITAPYDTTQLTDQAPTFTNLNPTNFKWAGIVNGTYQNGGWKWGQGQYWAPTGSWSFDLGSPSISWNTYANKTWNSFT